MFLSQVVLNPRHHGTYNLLADIYSQHRFVMSAYPDIQRGANDTDGAQKALNLLYRVDSTHEGRIAILVQAAEAADWNRTRTLHPDVICSVNLTEDHRLFTVGERYRFRLRANPTICRVNCSADGQRNPSRVGLYKESEQIEWMVRAADRHGFTVNSDAILVTPRGKRDGNKPAARPGEKPLHITSYAVDMDGLLTVSNPVEFSRAVSYGVGRGKAWGCGLLSVAPAQR